MPIVFSNVFHCYNPKSPYSFNALNDINMTIDEGKFIAIVGRTGSGKTTLVQHMNALLKPTQGKVEINGYVNSSNKKERTKKIGGLRQEVGMVFQFPEYQLFEETVLKDVAFGPKNFGATKEEAEEAAKAAMARVGLDESFYERSPFQLSGGEKRKVAIAGILAMNPKILVVDEPTAGLDPQASKDAMNLFKEILASGTTIILVSHDMDIVSEYADEVIVMENGKVAKQCTPEELFGVSLSEYSLDNPHTYKFAEELRKKGFNIPTTSLKNVDELAKAIKENIHG